MAERCPVCRDVLHPTQDGDYMGVSGCSVCHGKLWTPEELALARATAAARVAEAVKPWREALVKTTSLQRWSCGRMAWYAAQQEKREPVKIDCDKCQNQDCQAARDLLKAGP